MSDEGVPAKPLTSGLKDLMEVSPLGPDDRTVLARLREVLIEHDALDRFGVHLLHKHFDLDDGEVLVEQVNRDARTLMTKPVARSADMRTVETSWRFLPFGDDPQAIINCTLRCQWTVSGHWLQHQPF